LRSIGWEKRLPAHTTFALELGLSQLGDTVELGLFEVHQLVGFEVGEPRTLVDVVPWAMNLPQLRAEVNQASP